MTPRFLPWVPGWVIVPLPEIGKKEEREVLEEVEGKDKLWYSKFEMPVGIQAKISSSQLET